MEGLERIATVHVTVRMDHVTKLLEYVQLEAVRVDIMEIHVQ